MRTDRLRVRRQQILEAVVQHLLAHGFTDLSLRPLAAASGTSARLLIYHFGSKENLLRAAGELLRERIGAAAGSAMHAALGPGAVTLAMWQQVTRPDARRALLLLFEALARAMRTPEPWHALVGSARSKWRGLVDAALPPSLSAARRRQLLTLAMATLDGLLIELLASGDVRRTSAAMALFAREFERLSRLPHA